MDFEREFAQEVTKTKSLVPKTPHQKKYVTNWGTATGVEMRSMTAAVKEAIELKHLYPTMWHKLMRGPLTTEQIKILDMKTLTLLYYASCFFRANEMIPQQVKQNQNLKEGRFRQRSISQCMRC